MQLTNPKIDKIRNFSIIAHIDHGKSTLADRLIEYTGTISQREKSDRMLDTLELEQEKGITIKLQTVRMQYQEYILNLIDTPGHVDFAYEVSRSLAATEGALLLVDATQGIQAQTITTIYKALEYDLEIIPVINKIDLPSAEVGRVTQELQDNFGFTKEEILLASAKNGIGIEEILDTIVAKVPAPNRISIDRDQEIETKALVFDSFYHEHKGVVVLAKVESGKLTIDNKFKFMNSEVMLEPIEMGYLAPGFRKKEEILSGEVGYIATGLKDIRQVHVGDTITTQAHAATQPLPGYTKPNPMVFASIFPAEADQFPDFQEGLEKLALNDSALTFTKETTQALGSGFNCGFLGLLHLEVTTERLEREFDLDLVVTTPSVEYLVTLTTTDYSKLGTVNTANIDDDGILHVRNSSEFPDPSLVEQIEEPIAKLEILTPDDYLGPLMDLAEKQRGEFLKMEYLSDQQIAGKKHVQLHYEIPLGEIMTDFFDKMKSITQGYASMEYQFKEHRKSSISKVSILVNNEEVEALSFLCHTSKAEARGRAMVKKLLDIIPRQNFKVPLQAAIGSKVIARETLAAYRKDVTAKLYGGDVTRKRKLLEKQKKGKKRMQQFGKVEIPKSAFLAALSTD